MVSIKIIKERCKSCGLCIRYCPAEILEYSDETTKWGRLPHSINSEDCRECRLCELACPDFAINIEEEEE
ncbi:hypothetical protein AKJ39_04675 [candidate division MSBL1 archaeon SCGC-AAA259J03]|uniref:4Fe-4S ferredoxin-type domain-containing protein n=1 Tax=candidate division MSBL1 archaeon SCGC-AAA259J03 TaxID=1698269 RepID=A0A656YUQ1_9EURY|nr:hypothetical protein AKJ39_04675 [candidate division MSBL1 archaeon SCGC-AAA259J03]